MTKSVIAEMIDDVLVARITVAEMRDPQVVQEIKDELIKAVLEGQPRAIILDLSRLEFIGSVGFLALLATRRAASVQQIILCNMDDNVRKVFALCRLISHEPDKDIPFVVQSTLQSALAAASEATG